MAANELAERLEQIGRSQGIDGLALNQEGFCDLELTDGVNVSLHLSAESGELTLFSEIGRVLEENPEGTYNMLLDANFMWRDTGGATLGVDPESQTVILAQRVDLQQLDDPAVGEVIRSFDSAVDAWLGRMSAWKAANAETASDEGLEDFMPPPDRFA